MLDTQQKLSGQHCWRDDEFFSDSALSWKYDCWRYYCLVWYVSSQATTGVPIPTVAQICSKSLNENASPIFIVTFPNPLKAPLNNHQESERFMEVTKKSSQGQKETESLTSHYNQQLAKPVWREEANNEIMKVMTLKNKATRRMTLKNKATRRTTLKNKATRRRPLTMPLLRELMRRRQALRFPKVFNGLRRVDDRNHQCYYNPTACFWFTKICIIYEFRMREGLKGW